MSDASPFEKLTNTVQFYHWNNFNYPAAIAYYRQLSGDYLLNKTLFVHDSVYDLVRYKNIDQMWLFRRPGAYVHNYVLEHLSKLTRPLISYAATGVGVVLDKTAVQTWSSASPYNASYIFRDPDTAQLYLQQNWYMLQSYGQAVDRTSVLTTLFNLKKIWFKRVEHSFSMQQFIWTDRITSKYSILHPNRILLDKSGQLALAHFDVLTDRVAELIGWFGIGFLAYNLHPAVRLKTRMATDLWARRTLINYLPVMPRVPLKFFVIKPFAKVLYNPVVLLTLISYKLIMNLGQNIAALNELEQRDPELARRVRPRISSASYYNDLSKALLKRSGDSNGL